MDDSVVYITRQFNKRNECLGIYGVYKTEDGAKTDLLSNHDGLEFDYRMWRWEDRRNGYFYRIDAFILK